MKALAFFIWLVASCSIYGQTLDAELIIIDGGTKEPSTVAAYVINNSDSVIRVATRPPHDSSFMYRPSDHEIVIGHLVHLEKRLDGTAVIYPPGDLGIVELKPGEAAMLPSYRIPLSASEAAQTTIHVTYEVSDEVAQRYGVVALKIEGEAHLPKFKLPSLKKGPNQALQHNDPSCHAPCVRTCRASWGRG
jgi:hypothetical protein